MDEMDGPTEVWHRMKEKTPLSKMTRLHVPILSRFTERKVSTQVRQDICALYGLQKQPTHLLPKTQLRSHFTNKEKYENVLRTTYSHNSKPHVLRRVSDWELTKTRTRFVERTTITLLTTLMKSYTVKQMQRRRVSWMTSKCDNMARSSWRPSTFTHTVIDLNTDTARARIFATD